MSCVPSGCNPVKKEKHGPKLVKPVASGACVDENLFVNRDESDDLFVNRDDECSAEFIDEVVARVTSRFEVDLRMSIKQEMAEIVSRVSRSASQGVWTSGEVPHEPQNNLVIEPTILSSPGRGDKGVFLGGARKEKDGVLEVECDDKNRKIENNAQPAVASEEVVVDGADMHGNLDSARVTRQASLDTPKSTPDLEKRNTMHYMKRPSTVMGRNVPFEATQASEGTRAFEETANHETFKDRANAKSHTSLTSLSPKERDQKADQDSAFLMSAFRACKGWKVREYDDYTTENTQDSQNAVDLHPNEVVIDAKAPLIKRFVQSNNFDLMVAALICSNAIVMAIQLEHQGNETAEIGGYKLDSGPWVGADAAFHGLEHFFTIGFVIELGLRIWVNGWQYMKPWSNRLDALIVAQAVTELYVLGMFGITEGSVPNLSFLRLLRIIKLMRVLRIIRVMHVFRQLRILVHSIRASIGALFWSLTLLFVIQLITSIFMTQSLQPYLRDDQDNDSDQELVYDRFGTFSRAFLTMFEITFAPGAWGSIGRHIGYKVNRLYLFFFMTYCCSITFAIITIIRAIFLKETLSSANSDEDLVVAELAHEKGKMTNKLKALFQKIDHDNNGYISLDEMKDMLKDPVTVAVFSTLELTIREAAGFFELIDDGDGRLTFDEFLTGILRLKGGTKNVDLITCLFENKKMNDKMYRVNTQLEVLNDEILFIKDRINQCLPSSSGT